MDGKIGVESQLAIGSVFWITLPLVTRELMNIDDSKNEVPQQVLPGQMTNVLYIEDSISNQKVMSAFLKTKGNIHCATNCRS